MNESATPDVSHQKRPNTRRVSVDLSSRQLILPSIPLILLVAFGFTFYSNATAEPKVQWSGTSEKDGDGEITVQVDKTVVIEGEIDWWVGPFLVHNQSVSSPYEEIPEINRRTEETRGLWVMIAGACAFSVFIPAAWSQKWHSRWADGPPRVASGRAILIIVFVLSFFVGVCWLFKGMNPQSVEGLSNEFSGVGNLGWRMAAVTIVFPVAEELVFRAMLQRLLARRLSS